MRAALFLAVCVLASVLAACGGDDEGPATSPSASEIGSPPVATDEAPPETSAASVADTSTMTPGGGVTVPVADVEPTLQSWFERLSVQGDPLMWTFALTPPLPLSWPPTAETRWVRWAYATARQDGLADAVRVARIWGLAELHPGAKEATLRTSVPVLSAIPDPQGYAPLTGESGEALRDLDAASAAAVGLTAEPEPALAARLRRDYGTWLDTNGVIVGDLPDAHDAFIDWVRGSG